MRYTSDAGPAGGSPERIGTLLVNSGTPEAATPAAVRAFLTRFVSGPRVVGLPRAVWLPVLWGAILPLRPRRIARKYQQIWTATGSPLRELCGPGVPQGAAAATAQESASR
jgi:ferrochelatase